MRAAVWTFPDLDADGNVFTDNVARAVQETLCCCGPGL